ncbi:3-oxoacyl-[acyl-carrier-protein] synthase 3 [mine drainage metagenome]|uniref:3-oxoacyl-[acyl-carrier-protein] synthase 3 n=1 Tax=mine drainage metagenome TaxID=410659 RepID=A0A1J5PS71_9ZZZZ
MKCELKNLQIDAIASYLPKRVRNFESLESDFDSEIIKHTIKHSGIKSLHVADEDQTSSDMCFEAAEHLLSMENIDRKSIDGLVMVSQTFDYLGPASSVILQDRLGLSKDTVCFDIVYGCSGYIYGLYQAAILISSGSCERVLLVNGETNTRLMDDSVKEQYMVFGDAASATLMSKGIGELKFHICSDGGRHSCVLNLVNGFRPPILKKNNQMPLNSNGEFAKATNDGMAVFDFILHEGADTIREIANYSNWDIKDVDFFGLHQATKVTLDFLRRRLKITNDKAPFVSTEFGNTSSVTIPLVLSTCAKDENIDTKSWEKVILAAFGLGLSWGSISCDLSKTRFYGPLNM